MKIRKDFSFFTGDICGSACKGAPFNECKCGNETITLHQHYCCSNANCTKAANGDVTCSHGQILPLTRSCNHECSYRKESNAMAISSTCDYDVGCPSKEDYSKICINSDQVKNKEFGSFCDYAKEGISCSTPFNSKWSFEQCYKNDIGHIR